MTTRALIVGAGAMGQRHAAAIAAVGDAVSVVVDADIRRAESLAPEAEVVGTLEEALQYRSLFDVGVIATPSVLHLEQSVALVEMDVPVLVEKPHRIPGQNPDALRRALGTTLGTLFVGMSTRHWPAFEKLHEVISNGYLGEILTYRDRLGFRLPEAGLPDWYFDSASSGGGILVTNGVHAIDRLRALLGPMAVEETVLTSLFAKRSVDTYASVYGRANNATASIELIWSPFAPQSTGVLVTGTRGNALVRMDGSWTISARDLSMQGSAVDLDTVPFQRQWKAFLERRPGFGFDDLEPTLELIEQIYEGERHE
ncbi:Gfo/Idh/MocA family oxidoreductase [Leucobacter sp. CSA1]|uniref:Gfo/Idh/MocA family oxidoreductase n=1 Tax=Leucobacter chromiisoli TaxID=2796471 RepID=A0A934QB08_9MICO|nr:Gfo/Idh/MocA family oxidoreductase [Leucobacter chromiisoli]MBK0420436.1 Gfo/Idh/MocA family oxidoreductase [Leucobacter chromiisoli]